MVEWLPETDKNPPRPDVPVLRHLTWTESHAALLGASFGLLVFWGMSRGRGGVVFGLAVTVAQLVLGERQRKSKRSKCEHRIGVHDVREEPWYFTSAGVAAWIVAAVVGVFL
jgi:hypothetical protein